MNHTMEDTLAKLQYWVGTVSQILATADGIHQAHAKKKVIKQIGWCAENHPWVTLNTNGSVINPDSKDAAGGVLRNSDGNVLRAFMSNLGVCSITRADLRGVVDGLELAWQLGIHNVALRFDSRCATQLLRGTGNEDHQHAALLGRFRELRDRDWQLKIVHIYREANIAADYLAHMGHSATYGIHFLTSYPTTLTNWFLHDRLSITQPRLVSI
ncbi:Putative ribonuclease H protein At1g65750 [Linum grandiflorum]